MKFNVAIQKMLEGCKIQPQFENKFYLFYDINSDYPFKIKHILNDLEEEVEIFKFKNIDHWSIVNNFDVINEFGFIKKEFISEVLNLNIMNARVLNTKFNYHLISSIVSIHEMEIGEFRKILNQYIYKKSKENNSINFINNNNNQFLVENNSIKNQFCNIDETINLIEMAYYLYKL